MNQAFKKIDFHVHTPVSKCYSTKKVTFQQIAESAIRAGLQAMAITDHNTYEAIVPVREHVKDNELVVFPGVELSTRQGHVLGLFETDTPIETIADLLASVGIAKDARGDGTVMTTAPIERVFSEIDHRGGLAIAAHIERWPSGFLETKESRKAKRRIHDSPHLSALEITQPQNLDLWRTGKMRSYPKKYPCVQGSDAHALTDIGRRPTYVKLKEISLHRLRDVFRSDNASIKFPQELA